MGELATAPPTPSGGRARCGLVLAGRYRLDYQVGIGGMGEVWAASDRVLHRVVAVKLLRGGIGDDEAALERFRVEARHAASLTHPGVARVYDYGEETLDTRVAYLVMELVDGRPLGSNRGHKPFARPEVVELLAQAAEALGAAHALGLVHRDVKPANLLVSPEGVVKVTDFGIARGVGATASDGRITGTASYMSPEQAMGVAVTPSGDVYSLAVVGYQLLTGRLPFSGNPAEVAKAHVRCSPPPLPADVPAGLRDVIERSLCKNPTYRPPDGAALAAELRTVAQDIGRTSPADDGAPTGSESGWFETIAPTALDVTQVFPAPVGVTTVDGPTRPGPRVGALPATRRPAARRAVAGILLVIVAAFLSVAFRVTDRTNLRGRTSLHVAPTAVPVPPPTAPATTAPAPATTVTTPSGAAPVSGTSTPKGKANANTNGNGKGKGKGKGKGSG